jgi:hypothetical protein
MATQVQPSTSSDLNAIVALMCGAFGVGRDAYFVAPRLLLWKYPEAGSASELPRSYVLRQGDTPVAHCGAVRLTLMLPPVDGRDRARPVSAIAFMDWVGARQLPGAGIILKKKLMGQADVAIVVGGTGDTRAALPRIGFTTRQDVVFFARVARPFRQAGLRPEGNKWKDAARLARNVAWSLTPLGTVRPAWRAVRVERFSTVPASDHAAVLPQRQAAYLNYWLQCPVGRTAGYAIHDGDEAIGHFLVTLVGGQARITDVRVNTDRPEHWELAYRLATRTASADPETCEVVCIASAPAMQDALLACGFRERTRLPLYVADPKGKLKDAPPVGWSLIDNDLAYIYDAANPFLT